jgi:hypothetical protein
VSATSSGWDEGVREHGSSSAAGFVQASTTTLITGLTPGTNTFPLQHKAAGGTATFSHRTIAVIPLN